MARTAFTTYQLYSVGKYVKPNTIQVLFVERDCLAENSQEDIGLCTC